MSSQTRCSQCQSSFLFSDEDRALLESLAPTIGGETFSLPEPTECPDCRQRERAAHLNELHLYKRTCGLTGKPVLSDKDPEQPYIVYDQEEWHSDKWDPLTYGRDIDFNRPFFDQLQELSLAVPYPARFTVPQFDENSEYCNYAGRNKNCYLIFDSDENRDCYYSYSLNGCKDCMDCYRARQSELCIQCIDCKQCYGSIELQDCVNCSDCAFLKNCVGCRNCLYCINLRSKEYMVENKQVTKEEFASVRAMLADRTSLQSAKAHFRQWRLQFPEKAMHGVQNERCTGDYLYTSKNARECFDGENLWDAAYMYRTFLPVKNSMDCEATGEGERLYQCSTAGYGAYEIYFSANCLDQISSLFYCSFCFHSKNCFGCVSANRKQYCILNKQYTKEAYETTAAKLADHMQKTPLRSSGATEGQVGEWGKFFPASLSLCAYNESLAQENYPLTEKEAIALGYRWKQKDAQEYVPATFSPPATIGDVQDTVVKELLACSDCKRNYRITPQELTLLRQRNLPLPNRCFFCRHRERMAMRNPRKLWNRDCAKCRLPIVTSYSPDRPEIVECETCYLQDVS